MSVLSCELAWQNHTRKESHATSDVILGVNAVTETLFGSLKVERLHGETFLSVRAAKDAVIRWVLWYNQERLHSTIGYRAPSSSNMPGSCNVKPLESRLWKYGNRKPRDSHTPTTSTTTGLYPQPQRIWGTHPEGKVTTAKKSCSGSRLPRRSG